MHIVLEQLPLKVEQCRCSASVVIGDRVLNKLAGAAYLPVKISSGRRAR